MNAWLRTLEAWTTHQDYVWFLAVLAWAGVIAAELWRKENTAAHPPRGWLVALAASCAASGLIELALLVQNIRTPYVKFDLAMGLAQAAATAALAWQALAGAAESNEPGAAAKTSGRKWARGLALALLAGLAIARYSRPIEAGVGLCVVQALAVLVLWRQKENPLPVLARVMLLVAPVVATHGAWAHAIGHARKITDWSHFALAASGTLMVAGMATALAGWQRRLQEAMPASPARAETLRRDLRRAVIGLAGWLVLGVVLTVGSGWRARQSYEQDLMRRAETIAAALDARMLAQALGPEVTIESITHRFDRDGRPANVALVPQMRQPIHETLRTRMRVLLSPNRDVRVLYLLVARQGQMLVLNPTSSEPKHFDYAKVLVNRAVTEEDSVEIATPRNYLEGPILSPTQGARFVAKVALRHPETGEFLGWLVAEVPASVWAQAFVQARLQTMALVGAGVGLWTLAIAYRLRREARDAAEARATEAAAADQMKSAFLAKVSHELRTPIQSVLGYGEMLASAPLSETHHGWLVALRTHGAVMLRLVNDLIDLGALQSGAFRLEPAPVALRPLVNECLAALRPAAGDKQLELENSVADDVPAWVRADGVRLRQVLLNLLTNAVKFTPAGAVALGVRRAPEAPHTLVFVVSDTGPGIPAALRPRLFQPFARFDPSTANGSGLGLALVQGLCGAMGGRVRLDDTAARGATFVVELPLPACEPPAFHGAPSSAATARGFAGLHVLVVEDNTLVREMLTAFLTERGARVSSAADGLTAIARAREIAPQVMLLDVALPGADGYAVAETLRREGPRGLRIIGLSAHAAAGEETRARAAGMDLFLTKPVSLARLAEVLSEASAERQPRRPAAKAALEELPAALRARLEEQFATETPGVLAAMRAALEQNDWPEFRSRAHYLKNSADVIGATTLQESCRRIAALEKSPGIEPARELLAAVEAAVPASFFILADAASADHP